MLVKGLHISLTKDLFTWLCCLALEWLKSQVTMHRTDASKVTTLCAQHAAIYVHEGILKDCS